MPLKFSITHHQTGFLSPFDGFKPTQVDVDIRRDPLTGDRSRILSYRLRSLGKLDHSEYLERDKQRPCPFCPENLEKMAARFLPQEIPEGLLRRGEAVGFPNVFPYESHNAVLRLTKAHHLRPSQFTPRQLADGFLLAAEAFRRLTPKALYASVNWNYMMPAGGGQVHPHFQIVASGRPTRFQGRLIRRARVFAKREGREMMDAYLEHEKTEGSRWVGQVGPVAWLAPFAPRAIYDLMALSPAGKSLLELTPQQALGLARGMRRVVSFLEARGVSAYNMALHTSLQPGAGLPFMLRIVSRVHIPPMGVDEINYFEKLHDETVCFLSPEEMAQDLKTMWRD
ncbi:MAG: hypothetical protein KKB57_06910 [Proteobacteria bacterium]|nr:hypothetical protein [Pseudomonadota bacterium]MBU2517292.1 hypothetical protein [Pseudomonadota bacterium]